MDKIKETPKMLVFQETSDGIKIIYRQHKDDADKKKIKILEQSDKRITYAYEGKSIKEIVFIGFSELPKYVNGYGFGFTDRTLNNFIKFRLDDKRIKSIVIVSGTSKSTQKSKSLIIRASDFEKLLHELQVEKRAYSDNNRTIIKNFIIDIFPAAKFDKKETGINKKLILRNLNQKLINQLTADDVEIIGKFFVDATKKYKRGDILKRLSINLQKSSQLITLQEIINKYEELLKADPKESSWQSFFNEYITLFDSRYVHKIDYKNVATGITKYPDLVLVDIYGYVDFYELKKSSMPLLKFDSSHNNWYWSDEMAKVISQASDYLQRAKENAINYANTIKVETQTETVEGLDVNIISPRAIIVAGNSGLLNTDKKKNCFKNLRESMKDIEFILYDELLDRMKNLLDSIKIK